jgi:hypothetical protein
MDHAFWGTKLSKNSVDLDAMSWVVQGLKNQGAAEPQLSLAVAGA